MQFQVPQFETENKIVGPFNVVQFVYVAITTAVCFLLFSVLQIWLWFIISAVLIGSALAFALIKVNGRPMSVFSVAVFNYFWQPKVLIYQNLSVAVGLRNIRPSASGKKLDISAKTHTPEGTISIPADSIMRPTAPVMREIPISEAISPRPVITAQKAALPIDEKRPGSMLQDLFNRITVSSSPIPQRESSLKRNMTASKIKERYELIRKATGETEVVKRVDYR
ncbi:MAG: hypothetical protein PHG66_01320 [Candidatus Colwellbacteria bacterium]|nr:hypothetical protein [Candidatus Colwellbacteria bacterium]